ncbi:fibronectin type III domain-containing protein [Paenibacillus rigui]|uniref:Fibronectin type-III domain-containing protein n=1 Tax=Paenibacillus rigui TaxID=554312 RepID=A0A229UVJ6_9BACL|nr:fibronectin type III domain-containing protein [Paenibacillus rigui]OXM87400.1 hypothetical protein CF651_04650 [Paenibacillus rigui]
MSFMKTKRLISTITILVILFSMLFTNNLFAKEGIHLQESIPTTVTSNIYKPSSNSKMTVSNQTYQNESIETGSPIYPLNGFTSISENVYDNEPVNLMLGEVTSTSVNLKWDKPGNKENLGYFIYNGTELAGTVTTTTYSVYGLTPSNQYQFTIRGIDKYGNLSQPSNVLTVMTLEDSILQPAIPIDLQLVEQSESSVTLGWKAPKEQEEVTGFEIYMNNLLVATVTRETLDFTFNGLNAGTSYIFTLKAINESRKIITQSNELAVQMRSSRSAAFKSTLMSIVSPSKMLSMGVDYSVGLKDDGTVWQWGHMLNEQNGLFKSQMTPENVRLITDAVSIASGDYFGLALKNDGTVWGWGNGHNGQLGPNVFETYGIAKQIPGLSNVKSITTGRDFSVALKDDGTVWTWGNNNYGQLGNGTTSSNSPSPQQIAGLTGIIAVSAKEAHTLALKNDGTVWAWGYNDSGQLGDGSTLTRLTPQKVSGITNVSEIAAGGSHSLAIKTDGTVWAWGTNSAGILGNTSISGQSTVPVPVSLTGVFRKISAGLGYSLAIKNDGTIWSWGDNADGQLGLGSKGGYGSVPSQIQGFIGISSVTAGSSHSGAITSTGTYLSWGYNFDGQLGNGIRSSGSVVPKELIGPNLNGPDVVPPTIPISFYASINSNKVTLNWTSSSDNVAVQSYNVYNGNVLLKSNTFSGDTYTLMPGMPYAFSVSAIDTSGNESPRTNAINFQLPGVEPIKAQMALGVTHSLVLLNNGTVWAWGKGGLGNGMDYMYGPEISIRSVTPVQTRINDVFSIAAGYEHSLALKNDGTVWSWGRNDFGQLGNGTTANQSYPVQVSGLSNISAIAAGWYNSVALKSDGTVWTWGRNHKGQLGNGTTNDSNTPVQVANLVGVKAIYSSGEFTLALKNDGTVWAWGSNYAGQLGDGTTVDRWSPVRVLVSGEIQALAVGRAHSLVLKKDGTVWGWGNNNQGELGDGTKIDRLLPVQVIGINNVKGIAAGSYHSMAYMNNGSLWAWGYNDYGQVGNDCSVECITPIKVDGIINTVAIAAGDEHSAALTSDGIYYTWGYNSGGQLGNGTAGTGHNAAKPGMVIGPNVNPADTASPSAPSNLSAEVGTVSLKLSWNASTDNVAVKDYTVYLGNTVVKILNYGETSYTIRDLIPETAYNIKVKASDASGNESSMSEIAVTMNALPAFKNDIVAGENTSYALKTDGTLWSWGENNYGQLGDGTTIDRVAPVYVDKNIIDVAAGAAHGIALRNDKTVFTWGSDEYEQLGNGAGIYYTGPTVSDLFNIKQVAAGRFHSLALSDDGTVWSWGYVSGWEYLLGSSAPEKVPNLTNVKAIAAKGNFSLALKNDGTVWAWGSNSAGQMGDGTTVDSFAPKQVVGLQGIKEIRAGAEFCLALKNDGTLWTWGANDYGQLGNGTTSNALIPIQVLGIQDVKGIAAGFYHSMAYQEDGTLWTWGKNSGGQLGTGNLIDSTTPLKVQEITNAERIAGGYSHSAAWTSAGVFYAWGVNANGQIGNGTKIESNIPLQVIGPNVNPEDIVPPTAPLNLVAVIKPTSKSLNWKASVDNVGVSEYVIYNGSTLVATNTNGETTYILGDLPEGTSYSFHVVAKDATGNISLSSNIVTGVVDFQVPTPPRNLKVTEQVGDALTLSWSGSTDNREVAGYYVYNGSEVIGEASASTTTYTIKDYIKGDINYTYTFTVKAIDTAGNLSDASNWVIVETLADTFRDGAVIYYQYDGNGNIIKIKND